MSGRLALAERLGLADSSLNPLTEPDACAALVAETKGAYADVVFDALPGRLPETSPETRRLGMQLLRPEGEYIMYSAARDTNMPTIEMLAKGPRFHFAPYDSRVIDFTQRAQLMRSVLGMIEHRQIDPQQYVARQISFYSEQDVLQLFESYGQTDEVKVEIVAERGPAS
jgi:threonine dehydrogenase-like Zn-dependent dehydrogenase